MKEISKNETVLAEHEGSRLVRINRVIEMEGKQYKTRRFEIRYQNSDFTSGLCGIDDEEAIRIFKSREKY